MDDFWVLVNMLPSNCWGTKVQFLVLVPANRRGLCFSARASSVLQATGTHQHSLAAHWGRLETGYSLGKIKVYFLWETLNPFTAIIRVSAVTLWVTVWGHWSAVPHQDPAFLLGVVNHPRRSPSILRWLGAKPGAVSDIGHCSAGVALIRFICGLSVLWELNSGDTADPSSTNKANNTCLLHGAGEIKHNRRHFYSLKTTEVSQWQITFDKNLMWCPGIQPGILCKAQ